MPPVEQKIIRIILYIPLLILLAANIGLPAPARAAVNADMPQWKNPLDNLQIKIPNLVYTAGDAIKCTEENGQKVCSFPWIAEYIAGIYKYAIGIVGILAAVALMIGGVIWLTAGGNASMIGEAKSWIAASLSGLVIALCSYTILYYVNPNLVNFNALEIALVKKIQIAEGSRCNWIADTIDISGGGTGDTICGGNKSLNISQDSSKCGTKTADMTNNSTTYWNCCCQTIISLGGCSSTDTGLCAANNFSSSWNDLAMKASAVCMGESSNQCICNKDTWSCGPMQIHLYSGGVVVNGVDCKNYIQKMGPGDPAKYGYAWTQYGIIPGKEAEVELCKQKTCDINFFPSFSFQKYAKEGWGAWSITLNGQKCYALTHQ